MQHGPKTNITKQEAQLFTAIRQIALR